MLQENERLLFVEKYYNKEIVRELLYWEKVIGYDIDQILARSEIPVINHFNEKHIVPEKINPEDVHWNYNIKQIVLNSEYGRKNNISEEEAEWMEKDDWHDPDLLYQAPPNYSAVALVAKMHLLGKEQYSVTSRIAKEENLQPRMANLTHLWMAKEFPLIPKNHVWVDSYSGGADFKMQYTYFLYEEFGMRLFVEDYLSNALRMVNMCPNLNVLLVSKEYFNDEPFPDNPRIYRVPSMEHLNQSVRMQLVAQSIDKLPVTT